jgi:hypothetical protein
VTHVRLRTAVVVSAMRRDEAVAAVAELAAAQHGAFTRRQAADRGLSRRQIQAIANDPALAEPIRGVLFFRAAPTTWHQRMMIATLAPPGFHSGFRAAAFLHRLDGWREQPRPEIVGPAMLGGLAGST